MAEEVFTGRYDRTVVKYSVKYVRNMGDYESLHMEFGAEDRPMGEENVSQAMNRVVDFVDSKLFAKIDEVEEEIKRTRGK